MMFKHSFDVPMNTTAQDPSFQKLVIAKGRIIGWIVFMPEEAADLLQLHIDYHGQQIFPFSGSEWYYGVFQAILIPDDCPIPDSPYCLDVYAMNLDDSFSHEYNVSVLIEPEETPVGEVQPATDWFTKLRDLFGGT